MDKIHVMIVEDEPIVAQDIEETLQSAGYYVTGIASSGESALDLFRNANPDIVLLDINLKGKMDGIETAGVIKEMRDIPVIFLSGLSDKQTLERAMSVKPDAYITKPFNETQLQASVHSAIQKYIVRQVNSDEGETAKERGSEHFILNDSIFVKKRGRYHKIKVEGIKWLEVNDYLLTIVTEDGNFPLIFSLGKFVSKLHNPNIVQVHRSYAVNVAKVESYDKTCVYIGDMQIPVSRNSRQALIELFPKP